MSDLIQRLKEVEAYLRHKSQGAYAHTVAEVIADFKGLESIYTVRGEGYRHTKLGDSKFWGDE